MPSEHALLSPSAAHRWLRCQAAPRMEATCPDQPSEAAREGTLAHAWAARLLKEKTGQPTDAEEREMAQLAAYSTPEMEDYVNGYVAFVLGRLAEERRNTPDAFLCVETRLSFEPYVPFGFGTADAIIVADDTLEVIDLKYGAGVKVRADGNPQMSIYALGALSAFGSDYDIVKVRMTIYQPRMDNVDTAEGRAANLLDWGEGTLSPAATRAYYATGNPEAGEWCQFCHAKAVCPALAEMAKAAQADVSTLTVEDLAGKVLPLLPLIKKWVAAVEEKTLGDALGGIHYPGFKLVEGRSTRVIQDCGGAADALLAAGYEDPWRPRELKTITEMEKDLGKARFSEICGGFITRKPGKPSLVPESDRRPEYTPARNDFNDIEL